MQKLEMHVPSYPPLLLAGAMGLNHHAEIQLDVALEKKSKKNSIVSWKTNKQKVICQMKIRKLY